MAASDIGFPAITTPNALDLRAVQTAVGNARQRIEQLERLIATLTNAATSGSGSTTTSAQLNTLRNQVSALNVRVTALENATIDLEALISALPYNSGASPDMLVPVVIDGVAVTVTAGDIAALAASVTVDLAALIDALPFQSGADADMMVPVTFFGIGLRVTAGAIAALGGGSGGGVVVTEVDGVPSGAVTTLVFPNGSLVIVGPTATITLPVFAYGAAAPTSPNPGDVWVDSDSGILYTFVNDGSSSQWVEF